MMISLVTRSIKGKLLAVILLMAVVAVLIGGLGLNALSGMNSRLDRIVDVSAEKVRIGERIRQDLLSISRAEKDMILAETTEEQDFYASRIQANRDEMRDRRERLRELLTTEEAAQLDAFIALWEEYLVVNREVRELARANSNVKAQELSRTDGNAAYEALDSVLASIRSSADERMEEAAESENAEVRDIAQVSDEALTSARLSRDVAELQRMERSMILSTDPEEMKEIEARMLAVINTINSRFDELASLVGPDRADSIAEAKAAFGSYESISSQVRTLTQENSNARAFDLSATQGRELVAKSEQIIEEIVNHAVDRLDSDKAASDENFAATRTMMVAVAVSGILIGIGLAFWIVQKIVSAVKPVVVRAKEIAAKDLTGEPLPKLSSDEIGELTDAVNEMSTSLSTMVSEVTQSANEVAAAATEIAASAEEMSSGMSEQTDQVNQVSSAIEEMAQSITEVASKSAGAADNADHSGRTAQEGNEIVREAVERMIAIDEAVTASSQSVSELGRRGEQIGEIIGVINDIADQTNLLALNAAIEAARAGEHGRGFAVVADEVRKLADRTTKATDEIAESITAIQTETAQAVERMDRGSEEVKAGVGSVQQAGTSLSEIVERAQEVASMVSGIAAAAEEQSAASTQVSQSVQSINAITCQSAEGARQAAEGAMQMSERAEQLRNLVAEFKVA